MKKTLLLAFLAIALVHLSNPAKAQVVFSIGGHFGVDLDQDVTFAGALSRLDVGLPLVLQPSVDFGLNEHDEYTRAEGALIYYIGEDHTEIFTPYVGAGATFFWRETDADDDDDDFDVGPSVLGGLEFGPFGPGLVPYVQARYTILPGTDPLNIMGGLLIRFGRYE